MARQKKERNRVDDLLDELLEDCHSSEDIPNCSHTYGLAKGGIQAGRDYPQLDSQIKILVASVV